MLKVKMRNQADNSTMNDKLNTLAKRGAKQLHSALNQHLARVIGLRKDIAVKDSQLVSDDLGRRVPLLRWHVRMKVNSLRSDMREIIREIANTYESERFDELASTLKQNKDLNRLQSERGCSVLATERKLFISYNSLFFACRICAQLNDALIRDIDTVNCQSMNRKVEMELLLRNALMVYEISSLMIEMISGFQLDGEAEFMKLQADVFKELEESEEFAHRIVLEASGSPLICESKRREAVRREQAMTSNAGIIRDEWRKFGLAIDTMRAAAAALKIHRNMAELRLTRDMAKNQLDVLELVSVTQIMRDNFQAICEMVSIDLKLAPLNSGDIWRLIGAEASGGV